MSKYEDEILKELKRWGKPSKVTVNKKPKDEKVNDLVNEILEVLNHFIGKENSKRGEVQNTVNFDFVANALGRSLMIAIKTLASLEKIKNLWLEIKIMDGSSCVGFLAFDNSPDALQLTTTQGCDT